MRYEQRRSDCSGSACSGVRFELTQVGVVLTIQEDGRYLRSYGSKRRTQTASLLQRERQLGPRPSSSRSASICTSSVFRCVWYLNIGWRVIIVCGFFLSKLISAGRVQ